MCTNVHTSIIYDTFVTKFLLVMRWELGVVVPHSYNPRIYEMEAECSKF